MRIMDSITDDAGGGGAGGKTGGGDDGGGKGEPVVLPQLAEGWHNSLPEDMRNGMEAYKDIPSIVKTLKHAQSMVGADKVVIPNKNSTPEDIHSFYLKLGKPVSQEDYNKSLGLNEETLKSADIKGFSEMANTSNLLPEQAKGVLKWLQESNEKLSSDNQNKTDAQLAEDLTKLKSEWGASYEANVEKAKVAFKQISAKVPGAWEWMEKSNLSGDPMMLRMFGLVSGLVKEGTIHGEGPGQTGGTGDLQKDINTVMADLKHPYHDRNHPNHKIEVEQMNQRFAQLHPS